MIRRFALACLTLAICSFTFAATAAAEEPKKAEAPKEVKLEGKITCAMCELGIGSVCASVIVVKENGKDVTYFFDKDADKKYRGDTCGSSKPGTVKGTVKKDGDKMIVTVKDVEFKK